MGLFSKYKDDTRRILAWLVQTARDHGCNVKVQDFVDPIAARSGRHPEMNPDAPPKKLITTREILRIIDGLSKQRNTTYVMPRLVKQSYESAIKIRQRYNDYYDEQDDVEPADKLGHAYFVWVLRQVKDRLGHMISVQDMTPAISSGAQPSTSFVTAGLLFDLLPEVEDTFDPLDDAAAESAPPSAAASSNESFEIQIRPEEELRLDWFLLLKSCEPLIEKVAEKWSLTQRDDDKRIDIAVAALLTDAAVELIYQEKEKLFSRARELRVTGQLKIASDADDLLYLPLTVLQDIMISRRQNQNAPILLVKKIEHAHPELGDNKSIQQSQFLVHYMFDLGIECDQRKEREKPVGYMKPEEQQKPKPTSSKKPEFKLEPQFLSRSSLDMLSQSLQPVNEGQDVTFEAALSAKILLAIDTQRDTEDKKTAHQKLKGFGAFMFDRTTWYEQGNTKMGLSDELLNNGLLFRKTCEWVHNWPVPTQKKDLLLKYVAKTQLPFSHIYPHQYPFFLRLRNQALSGKLRLNLLVIWEEFTTALCNQSVHLYSMAYLYTVLKQRGYLRGKNKQHEEITWKNMDGICFVHSRDLFIEDTPKELPTDLERLRDRFKVASGIDIKWILQSKKGEFPKPSRSSSRQTWDISSVPMLIILRDYFHEKVGLLRTLYRMDTYMQSEMQKNIPAAKRKSYIDDFGILAFMEKLQVYAVEEVRRCNSDYMRTYQHVTVLFQKMDKKMANVERKLSPALAPKMWHGHNYKSWQMVDLVLQELIEAEQAEQKHKKKRKASAPPPQLPLTTIAADVLKKYMLQPGRDFA